MKGQLYRNRTPLSVRHLLFLFLILFVLTKSVRTVFVQISDVKYELFVDSENSDVTEQENERDFDEDQESEFILNMQLDATDRNTNLIKECFSSHKNILDFNLNILLPPPRL